jgi:hypothetical protein
VPWYKRLSQYTNPSEFQNALLKDNSVVWTPSQMGLPEMVMAGTAELNKEIMNGDGDFVSMFSPVVGECPLRMPSLPKLSIFLSATHVAFCITHMRVLLDHFRYQLACGELALWTRI